jgi:hypothetical protein
MHASPAAPTYEQACAALAKLEEHYDPPHTPTVALYLGTPVKFAAITVADPRQVAGRRKKAPKHITVGSSVLPVVVVPDLRLDHVPEANDACLDVENRDEARFASPSHALRPLGTGDRLSEGTVGWLVRSGDANYFLMCWHSVRRTVGRYWNLDRPPELVEYVDTIAGGVRAVRLGALAAFVELLPVESKCHNFWDLAIIKLDPTIPVQPFCSPFDTLPAPTRVVVAEFGREYELVRSAPGDAGLLRGHLLGLGHGTFHGMDPRVPQVIHSMKRQLIFDPMSGPGDSGALVFSQGRELGALAQLFGGFREVPEASGAELVEQLQFHQDQLVEHAVDQIASVLSKRASVGSPLVELDGR